MKILVVDDEPLARERLRDLLTELGHQHVTLAGNGKQALAACSETSADIVLLDIRMPGMDGMEVAHHLAGLEAPPAVIFVTAYDDHALAAFEAGAIDYLVKPVRIERLATALSRCSRLPAAFSASHRSLASEGRQHVSATVRGQLVLVAVAEIRYFRAEQKYTVVGHPQHTLLIEDSLKTLETEFAGRFLRVHRNALVAKEHIQRMTRQPDGSHQLLVADMAEELQVSRRMVSTVKQALRQL